MRINVIPPELLSDVHLRAEYREILMAQHYYKTSTNSKSGIIRSKISPVYTLNAGHAYLWYDKMLFIKERHDLLEIEMKNRNFKTREKYSLDLSCVLESDMNSYKCTKEDLIINLERVLERTLSKEGKNFYKYKGVNYNYNEWEQHFKSGIKRLLDIDL